MRNRKLGAYTCVALPVRIYAGEDIMYGEVRYKKGECVSKGAIWNGRVKTERTLIVGSYFMIVPRIRFNLRTIRKGGKR